MRLTGEDRRSADVRDVAVARTARTLAVALVGALP